ncbi:MAG: hypothetical protein WBN89_02575 [Prochlorococcaceae cyanobacterium]
MDHPIWTLIPWVIVSVALALKVWRFTGLVRRHLMGAPAELENARALLERSWQRDQQEV